MNAIFPPGVTKRFCLIVNTVYKIRNVGGKLFASPNGVDWVPLSSEDFEKAINRGNVTPLEEDEVCLGIKKGLKQYLRR